MILFDRIMHLTELSHSGYMHMHMHTYLNTDTTGIGMHIDMHMAFNLHNMQGDIFSPYA